MAGNELKWRIWRSISIVILWSIVFFAASAEAQRRRILQQQPPSIHIQTNNHLGIKIFVWKSNQSAGYRHVWPDLKFGWKVVVGSIIGFLGAAFGSIGGVGGGGIFVPMLTLIIGFDAKSATAISKCMIMGASVATVYYNLKLRHPTIEMPIIDYDLALLIQPMLMLGISIGVAFNVIFADWMVTVLLIILFLGTSTKAFCRGVETWNKETALKKEAAKRLETNETGGEDVEYNPPPGGPSNGTQNGANGTKKLEEATKRVETNEAGGEDVEYKPPPGGPNNGTQNDANGIEKLEEATKHVETNEAGGDVVEYKPPPSDPSNGTQNGANGSKRLKVSIIENVYWKELGLLCFVWVAFLALQISKKHTPTCSIAYWALNLLQLPVAFGVSMYEGISLYKGSRVIASKGESGSNLKAHQIIVYCSFGILAGLVGGMLGLGGGFIMTPLFLELGVPPEVSSATSTFAMMFSSSMSVIEYYLLKRFPVPYALYLTAVATIAAFVGQQAVRKLIMILGRASLIIFVLASTIFVSAISLGGVGISNMVHKFENHEYMGFENLCNYDA